MMSHCFAEYWLGGLGLWQRMQFSAQIWPPVFWTWAKCPEACFAGAPLVMSCLCEVQPAARIRHAAAADIEIALIICFVFISFLAH
jgi:hypothetical protein